ncbi:hypothetical protein PoB_003564200 [Plakobranchus ocellatus]|uniref:Uncharacterized protein n=1 Tax=Plakobranchus ocellatus TaxID=259542 RepID=A0AAV4AQB9_9GAST|nr:hypothetical protein PoB_003564200 [Plakobranchus ocellatus]
MAAGLCEVIPRQNCLWPRPRRLLRSITRPTHPSVRVTARRLTRKWARWKILREVRTGVIGCFTCLSDPLLVMLMEVLVRIRSPIFRPGRFSVGLDCTYDTGSCRSESKHRETPSDSHYGAFPF